MAMLRVAASSECNTVVMCWCDDDEDGAGGVGDSGVVIADYINFKVKLASIRRIYCLSSY
jgi:hypothetical protein